MIYVLKLDNFQKPINEQLAGEAIGFSLVEVLTFYSISFILLLYKDL